MKNMNKPNSSLEKLRGIFFQVGLIVASGLVLVAFEWTTPVIISELPTPDIEIEGDMELPPITYSAEKKPDIKQPEPPKVIDPWKIKVVPDPTPVPDPDPVDPIVNPVEFNPDWITKEKEPEEKDIPVNPAAVGVMPQFGQGVKDIFKFLGDNLKYPTIAKENGIQGTVHLKFVVGKNGKVRNIEILRGVNKLLDEEAVRVVQAMPDWQPGKQHGKPVSVFYTLPIKFTLK